MIRAGDSIVNPVTGERLVFELTSHDTNGELTRFETFVEPGGAVAAAHVHPYQAETFTVLEGTLGMKRGREKLELRMQNAHGEDVRDDSFLLLFNAHFEDITFRLPARRFATRWEIELATGRCECERLSPGRNVLVESRSIALLRRA